MTAIPITNRGNSRRPMATFPSRRTPSLVTAFRHRKKYTRSVTFTQLFAGSPDIEAILGPIQRLYEHDRIAFDKPAALAALHGLLNDPRHGVVWAIKEEEGVIGYAVVTFGYSLEFRGVDAFLDELYVMESHRGRASGGAQSNSPKKPAASAASAPAPRSRAGQHRRAGGLPKAVFDHDRYCCKWISVK